MKRDLKFERFLKHPPPRVWKALTDPKALAAWYMDNDFQPVPGHKFTFRADPGPGFDGRLMGEVLLVDEPYQLAYSFRGGYMKHETKVLWTLMPKDGGTLLRLDHTGFTGHPDLLVSFIIGFGWGRYLKRLPEVLATWMTP